MLSDSEHGDNIAPKASYHLDFIWWKQGVMDLTSTPGLGTLALIRRDVPVCLPAAAAVSTFVLCRKISSKSDLEASSSCGLCGSQWSAFESAGHQKQEGKKIGDVWTSHAPL